MANEKIDITDAIDLSSLAGSEHVVARPGSCTGNACDFISTSATFNQSGTVRSMTITSSSPKPVKVGLDWADPFGYCGVSNSDTLAAFGSVEFFAPTAYNPGYCKIRASF
jgi:hypothetical protein